KKWHATAAWLHHRSIAAHCRFCRHGRNAASAPRGQGRPIRHEQCSGLLAERGALLVTMWFGPAADGDSGDEAVTAPGNVYDESVAIAPVARDEKTAPRPSMSASLRKRTFDSRCGLSAWCQKRTLVRQEKKMMPPSACVQA